MYFWKVVYVTMNLLHDYFFMLFKLGPHNHLGQQRNPINFRYTRSKVKVHRGQICQNYVTISKKNFFFIPCATYFEQTNPVVQNICDKQHFRVYNGLQTSLVVIWFQMSVQHYSEASYCCPVSYIVTLCCILEWNFRVVNCHI